MARASPVFSDLPLLPIQTPRGLVLSLISFLFFKIDSRKPPVGARFTKAMGFLEQIPLYLWPRHSFRRSKENTSTP